MEEVGRCNRNNIEIGSYDRQIWLHAPNHIPKENGYCIDLCIAQEITYLWMQGIKTHGCCCGHNKVEGFIGVEDEYIENMKKLCQYSSLSMGWCVNCHRQPENIAPLNFTTCHQ